MDTTEVTYPIPLKSGFIVTVKLPVGLTTEDAEKVSAVVLALVAVNEPNQQRGIQDEH